ncbi:phospholipase C [Jatrophihabitans fulvus]
MLTRRRFLALGGAGVAAAGATAALWHSDGRSVVEQAHAFDPGSWGSLGDVDHIVVLLQENRSFDHYFGARPGVTGWRDYVRLVDEGRLPPSRPWRLRPGVDDEIVFTDPDHTWRAAHDMFNGGRIDADKVRGNGRVQREAVMGYYTRRDLPVHYDLADAFTLCDSYHCSVLGPTAPNRLFWMSGTLGGADGGGPVTAGVERRGWGTLQWTTMPQRLSDAGVSWKVYNAHGPSARSDLDGMMKYFRAVITSDELASRGVAPRWPHDFMDDVAHDNLPSVSWIVPPMATSEHPSRPPAVGAEGIMLVLRTLLSNPAVWERTALVVAYDENGGFFDHVAPPTPPAGTPGEFVLDSAGRPQPIGLGYRVPCFVVSPFTRGGAVSSSTFDHTSQLRLIGARFGVPVPNVTPWRRSVTGDMTELFGGRPRRGAPALPPPRAVDRLADRSLDAWRAEQREHGEEGRLR